MIDKWRFLDTDGRDAFFNMGLDEAIVIAREKNLVPNTLRFFRWEPSAVSIGYFQSMEEEVDVAECDRRGVDYVRRRTGGGAVYHDRDGELTYSIIISEDHKLVSTDIQKTYQTLCSGLTVGLNILGIPAKFKIINDIVVDGKKISGNAQTRRKGVVHQHGTILIKVDPSLMFKLLKVPNEKIRDKLISSVEERVTSINSYLKKNVSLSEINKAFKTGFERAFNIKLDSGQLIGFEIDLAKKLKKEKYASKDWNFGR